MPSKSAVPELSRADLARIKQNVQKTTALNSKRTSAPLVPMESRQEKVLKAPHYLTETHHQKLKDMKKNEQLMSKRSRLRSLLVQKLTSKYGVKNSDLITELVTQFITRQNEHISSADLMELENEIRVAIRGQKQSHHQTHPNNGYLKNQESFSNQDNNETLKSTTTSMESTMTPVQGHEWDLINAYGKLVADERYKKEEDDMLNKKSVLKKTLEKQIEEAREIKRQEREAEQRLTAERMKRDLEKLKEEEALKAQEIARKHEEERLIRDQQVLENRRRREMEQYSMKAAEKAELDRILQIQKNEVETAQKKRHEDIIKRDEIFRANDELRRIRDLHKKEQLDEEHRLMQEYSAKLEKEAYERDNAFRRRVEALESFSKKFKEEGAGRSQFDSEKKQDEALLRMTEKKIKEIQLMEHKKEEERKLRETRMLQENMELRRKRELERLQAKKDDDEYVQKMRRDNEEYAKFLQNSKMAEIEKKRQYREALNAQLGMSSRMAASVDFSDKELVINGGLLKNVTQNPDLFVRVQEELATRPNATPNGLGSGIGIANGTIRSPNRPVSANAAPRAYRTPNTVSIGNMNRKLVDDWRPAVAWMSNIDSIRSIEAILEYYALFNESLSVLVNIIEKCAIINIHKFRLM
eukprot:gene11316-23678_t